MSEGARFRAGALSAALDGGELVDVRWGGLEVASRILVTVRDPGWGTVPSLVRSRVVEEHEEGFAVELDAVHEAGPIAFAWRGRIDADARGVLRFGFDGVAERDFDYCRIGVCVLHPTRTYVGATYRAAGAGPGAGGIFPDRIAPQPFRDGHYRPMIDAFTSLDVALGGGVRLAFGFEGERFELEDQRNWTDASFKTYPTPLASSAPRGIRAGVRVTQRVTLRLSGPPPPATVAPDVTDVRIGGPSGIRMPPIGLTAPGDRPLRPAHLRVDVDATQGWPGALERTTDVPIEVALSVGDDLAGLEALAPVLARTPIARVLVHRADGDTIDARLVDVVRRRVGSVAPGVPFVGGTSSYFSELNRHPPARDGVDAVSFAISATVHATDERSIVETLAIQGLVVGQARELAGGLPVVVSPISLHAHRGTPFADAWTVGSAAALAAAGAASLTFAEPATALARAIDLEGEELLEVDVTPPDRIAVLATTAAVVLANLTGAGQPFRLRDGATDTLAPYEVRVASTG